jgi:uroporphyrinogen decarboxylase
MIDTLNRANCIRARVFAEANIGPLFFIGDDIAFKGRTMFSLPMLRELFFPYLKRMCEPLVNAGIKVIFHTDGYCMEIIDDLIDCGVAGLNPLEPLAGNDIAEIKRRWGDNLILVGGMDCAQLLPLGTVQDVRDGTRRLLREAGHGGGLFIGSSSEIVPATPVENIFAFYEACHEFGRYPLMV